MITGYFIRLFGNRIKAKPSHPRHHGGVFCVFFYIMDLIYFYLMRCVFISYICFIWLDTNAFYEYILKHKLFNKWSVIKEYKNNAADISFALFLRSREDFVPKLLSCSICTTFWLSVLTSAITGGNIFVLAFFSLVFYRILSE